VQSAWRFAALPRAPAHALGRDAAGGGGQGDAGADPGPADRHDEARASRLSDHFETRVKVDLGQRKGRITVEFATLDDLRRIVEIMDPRNRVDRPI